jgi:hypothetical protein
MNANPVRALGITIPPTLRRRRRAAARCAVAGVGVVLLPTWLVGEEIKAGRLPPSRMVLHDRHDAGRHLWDLSRIVWRRRRCAPFLILPRNGLASRPTGILTGKTTGKISAKKTARRASDNRGALRAPQQSFPALGIERGRLQTTSDPSLTAMFCSIDKEK